MICYKSKQGNYLEFDLKALEVLKSLRVTYLYKSLFAQICFDSVQVIVIFPLFVLSVNVAIHHKVKFIINFIILYLMY